MEKGVASSLSKATLDYNKPPYSASPNLQEATIVLFSLSPSAIGALIAQVDGDDVE